MAKKSVLGHPDSTPRLSREGFSLDQQFTFTASCGQLLPVWYDLLNPGETLKGSPSFLIRTENFLAPAMADIDCFCDIFFVPMQKILSAFGEWFYQIDDIKSDFNRIEDFSEYLPLTYSPTNSVNPWSGFTSTVFNSFLSPDMRSRYLNQYFDSFGFGLHRLLFHFGMNPQSIFFPIFDEYGWQDEAEQTGFVSKFKDLQYNVDCPNFCPYWFAAYQGIYYDYYRMSEYESNNIKAYNLDSVFNDGQEIDMDSALHSESAGSRRGMFELRYRWRSKDYFMATRSTPLINSISMMPDYAYNLRQVNQWLTNGYYQGVMPNGQAPSYDAGDPQDTITTFGIRLDQTLARNTGNSVYSNDASLAYYDDEGSQIFDTPGNLRVGDNDYQGTGYILGGDPNPDGVPIQVRTNHTHSYSGDVSLVLTTSRIRTAFALEKLQRITQRAGKHYDDQTLVHFGFKVNQGLSGEVYKIGSYHTMLGIQKVTSTADTQGAALGEQAGVGFGLLDGRKKKFSFTAPCHGIVMAIWSCAPRYKYIGAVDKLGFKTRLWDFYKPSLDNLGSQPLFAYETNHAASSGSGQPSTAVVGWQWRFMESKVKFNRVSPVFATTGKNPWSMVSLPETPVYEGQVSPTDLNDLLNAQYSVAPAWPEIGSQQDHVTSVGNFVKAYLRDPFVVDFKMDSSKVSTMSTFGEENLNGI